MKKYKNTTAVPLGEMHTAAPSDMNDTHVNDSLPSSSSKAAVLDASSDSFLQSNVGAIEKSERAQSSEKDDIGASKERNRTLEKTPCGALKKESQNTTVSSSIGPSSSTPQQPAYVPAKRTCSPSSARGSERPRNKARTDKALEGDTQLDLVLKIAVETAMQAIDYTVAAIEAALKDSLNEYFATQMCILQEQSIKAVTTVVRSIPNETVPLLLERSLVPRISRILQEAGKRKVWRESDQFATLSENSGPLIQSGLCKLNEGTAVVNNPQAASNDEENGPKTRAEMIEDESEPRTKARITENTVPSLTVGDRVARAKFLVGRLAAIWLLQATERRSPPENPGLCKIWACESSIQCFKYVTRKLREMGDDCEAISRLNASYSNKNIDLAWFLNPGKSEAIKRARKNYQTRDPPLCNVEWNAEASVLRDLGRRFSLAQLCIEISEGKSTLQVAIELATAEAQA